MFINNFKYSFKVLIRNKGLIFWTFAFPIILGIFFNMAFSNIEKDVKGTKVLHHDYFTNGIYYIDLYFDIKPLLAEYAPYISLLTSLIGCVDTDGHDKLAFSNEILQNAGDFTFDTLLSRKYKHPKEYKAFMIFRA